MSLNAGGPAVEPMMMAAVFGLARSQPTVWTNSLESRKKKADGSCSSDPGCGSDSSEQFMQQRQLVMQQRFVVRRRQRLRWWLWRVWRIMIMPDRFGLGWRHKLALGILSHLDRIDIVEVIADDYFRAPHRERRALARLLRRRRSRCTA